MTRPRGVVLRKSQGWGFPEGIALDGTARYSMRDHYFIGARSLCGRWPSPSTGRAPLRRHTAVELADTHNCKPCRIAYVQRFIFGPGARAIKEARRVLSSR